MKCLHVQDRLVLYLAREMSPAEYARITDHVSHCAECFALAEELAATQERLESVLNTNMEAPATLDARVMRAVRDLQVNQNLSGGVRTRWRRPMVYAIPLCCLMLVALAITTKGRSGASSELDLASLGEAHNRLTGAERPDQFPRSDAKQLAVQLSSAARFPVRVSDLTPEGAQLVGGNRIIVENSSLAELHYLWQGKQISVFEMDSSNRTPAALRQLGHERDAYYAHKSGDMAYIAWHSGKTECVMVARQVPMHQLFHLACKACERQEEAAPTAVYAHIPLEPESMPAPDIPESVDPVNVDEDISVPIDAPASHPVSDEGVVSIAQDPNAPRSVPC